MLFAILWLCVVGCLFNCYLFIRLTDKVPPLDLRLWQLGLMFYINAFSFSVVACIAVRLVLST